MNTQTITIKGDGVVRGKYSNLDMAVWAGCKCASKKQINNDKGVAEVEYIFEGEENLEDWVLIEGIEKYGCTVVAMKYVRNGDSDHA